MAEKPLVGGIRLVGLVVVLFIMVLMAGLALAGTFTEKPEPSQMEAAAVPNVSFEVHNSDPNLNITVINITLPSGLEFVTGSDYTNATGTSISNSSDNVTWSNTSAAGILENGSTAYFNMSFLNMTDIGNYTFTITAEFTDGSTNSSSSNVTIKDTTPPSYLYDTDNPSTVESGDTIQASAYWYDIVELDIAILRTNETGTWDNRSYHAFTTEPEYSNLSIDTTGQPNESICWVLWANDTSGNMNSSMGSSVHCFYVDDTTPPSDIVPLAGTPENGTWVNTDSVYINFTFTELSPDTCLYDNVTVNQSASPSGNNCSFLVAGYNETAWNYTVWINDTMGNLAWNGTYYLGYDNTEPGLNSLGLFYQGENISGGNITNRENITISLNITDALSGVNASAVWANIYNDTSGLVVTVDLSPANGDFFNGTWEAGTDNSGSGVYMVEVNGTDEAGNTPSQGLTTSLDLLGAPDLAVVGVEWSSSNANQGWPTSNDDITLNITIGNIGDDNFSESFNVTTRIEGSLKNRSMLSNLNETESVTLNLTFTSGNFSTNKWYVFTVQIDPEDVVNESTEGNNTHVFGITLGYNISLVKLNNTSPPDVGMAFPDSNITVNISVTYGNGSGVTGLSQNAFDIFNDWGGNAYNMSNRIYSWSASGGYYRFNLNTMELYSDAGGNKTRPYFGDNELNISVSSGSYSGEDLLLYNITAPDLNVHIDIDDIDLAGSDYKEVDFNLTITNNGNAPAFNIKINKDNDWEYVDVFDVDTDPDTLTLSTLNPGESHTFDDCELTATGTQSGNVKNLYVFVHYNDSVNNEYQGFDYDKVEVDDSGDENGDEDGGTTNGGTTGGELDLELTLTDWADEIQGYAGSSNTTEVKVKNTGDVTVVAKVDLTCAVIEDEPTVSPISKSLAVDISQEFIVDFNIKDDTEIGEYDCKVKAYVSNSVEDYDEETIVLRIQATEEQAADIEESFENITSRLNKLLEELASMDTSLVNETTLTKVQKLLKEANDTLKDIQEAINSSDYITASSLLASLEASMDLTEQAFEELEEEYSVGGGTALSGTWFWAVIIIVIVIAVAFVAYLMFPQKTYAPKRGLLDSFKDTMKGGATKVGEIKAKGKPGLLEKKEKPFRPGGYPGQKMTGFAEKPGVGTKIKGALSKLKDKLRRRKRPQKEVTQYFVNSSSNIINYSGLA